MIDGDAGTAPGTWAVGPAFRFLAVSALRFSICARQVSRAMMSERSSMGVRHCHTTNERLIVRIVRTSRHAGVYLRVVAVIDNVCDEDVFRIDLLARRGGR